MMMTEIDRCPNCDGDVNDLPMRKGAEARYCPNCGWNNLIDGELDV